MLTNEQKKEIRKIFIYEYSSREKKGKPITHDGKIFVIPSFSELTQSIFEEISKLGYSKIERVHPNEANCIIRLCQKLHYKYERELVYNIYGAICFTKKSGSWFHEYRNGESKIDFSKEIMRHWLYQDEYIDFDFDFADVYVKIS